MSDLLWRDALAARELRAAAFAADRTGLDPLELRGRLGELLFAAGRYGEAAGELTAGAVGEQRKRRLAFAQIARQLPFARQQRGPLATEQPLLPGEVPEFVCRVGARERVLALDTGTSMTTLARSVARDLGVRATVSAGEALDGTGQPLAVDVGILDELSVGDVLVGATPVLVVDDQALALRDQHGGAERPPAGVLGLDLLASFRITIDPERSSLVLSVPSGLSELDSVQCVRAEGRCLVPLWLEGQRMWFVLDTGASHSSLTDTGLAALPGGEARAAAGFRRVRSVGGGVLSVREVRDLVLRVGAVRFAGVTLPVVPRQRTVVFPVHGVLGIDLLGRCRVTLDQGRARFAAAQ